MAPGRHAAACGQAGFTYVAMLFALAIFGIGLAALGETWSSASHRDKEEELIQIGRAYVHAIGQYYVRSPGNPKAFPLRLEDLTEDRRFFGSERHLRRLYKDPFTNRPTWGLVRAADGGIAGIYSLSEQAALRRQALAIPGGVDVAGERYVDWKFIYQPGDSRNRAAQ